MNKCLRRSVWYQYSLILRREIWPGNQLVLAIDALTDGAHVIILLPGLDDLCCIPES